MYAEVASLTTNVSMNNSMSSTKSTATCFASARRVGATLAVSLLLSHAVSGADLTVTSPGFFYSINGNQPNPTLTLVRGQTYTFVVNASSIHPFKINSPGVQNNNVFQGTIT